MKIWITRSTAFSIQCGGLERLFVWFREPRYVEKWDLRGMPPTDIFDEESPRAGIRVSSGWEVPHGGTTWINGCVSFGKLFGYEGEIPDLVWSKLEKHFGNKPFDTWHEYERENPKSCNVSIFLLEIEIDIKLK